MSLLCCWKANNSYCSFPDTNLRKSVMSSCRIPPISLYAPLQWLRHLSLSIRASYSCLGFCVLFSWNFFAWGYVGSVLFSSVDLDSDPLSPTSHQQSTPQTCHPLKVSLFVSSFETRACCLLRVTFSFLTHFSYSASSKLESLLSHPCPYSFHRSSLLNLLLHSRSRETSLLTYTQVFNNTRQGNIKKNKNKHHI